MAAPVITVTQFNANDYDATHVGLDLGILAPGATQITFTWDPGVTDQTNSDNVGIGHTYEFGPHDLLVEAQNGDGTSSLAFDVQITPSDTDPHVLTGTVNHNNMIVGGNGKDTITGSIGIDLIAGRDGDDMLIGGAGDDILNGDSGFFSVAGNDTLNGGAGADTMFGYGGSDIFVFTTGDVVAGEVIDGGQIDPVEPLPIAPPSGAAAPATVNTLQLDGTVHFDLAEIADINAIHFVAAGRAEFSSTQLGTIPEDPETERGGGIGLFLDSTVKGSAGLNELVFKVVTDGDIDLSALTFTTWAASDHVIITSDAGDHQIKGSAVNDMITTVDGKDFVQGLGGDDTIAGGRGDDVLNGNDGDDDLDGGKGDDVLLGKAGDDIVHVSLGQDVINGDTGRDTLDFSDLSGKVDIDLRTASYTLAGGDNQTFIGMENVIGGDKADDIAGDGGANVLKGGKGADTLTGNKGADDLYAGNDGKKDVFVFLTDNDSGKKAGHRDQIFQFDGGRDKIDLSALNVSWNDISLNEHGSNVKVGIDTHGSHKADMAIVVMSTAHLHQDDFVL